MTSFDVTRLAITLGSYDSTTGWPAKLYSKSTVGMIILPRGESFNVGGMGFYAQYEYSGFTCDVIADGDEVKDASGQYYRVNSHRAVYRLNTFQYYECALSVLEPHNNRASTSGTWHLDSSDKATDPRCRHKIYLDEYLTTAAIKKDDGVTNASWRVMFDEPDFHWVRLFDVLSLDAVIMVSRGDTKALSQYNKVPYAFDETCTLKVYAINKSTVTAVNLVEQIEQEIRNALSDYAVASGSSFRSLERVKAFTDKVSGVEVHGLELTLRYVRANHDYTPSLPTVSYGTGFFDDFTTFYSPTIYTATSDGDAGGTTIINTTHTEADDYWNGKYVKMLTGSAAGSSAIISDFTASTDTITLAGSGFGVQIADGDTYQISTWAQTKSNITSSVPSIDDGEAIGIPIVVSANGGYTYLSYPNEATATDNLSLATNVYKYIMFRYYTSLTTGVVKAKIEAVFSDATTQTVLDYSAAESGYVFGSVALTAGKTLNHIRLYAYGVTSGDAGNVVYDFVAVYKDDFVLPNCVGAKVETPLRDAENAVYGKIGSSFGSTGAESASVTLTANLDFGNWKRTGDKIDGEVFIDIAQMLAESSDANWIWLDYDYGAMKARYTGASPSLSYSGDQNLIELNFKEYSSPHTTYANRFHIT